MIIQWNLIIHQMGLQYCKSLARGKNGILLDYIESFRSTQGDYYLWTLTNLIIDFIRKASDTEKRMTVFNKSVIRMYDWGNVRFQSQLNGAKTEELCREVDRVPDIGDSLHIFSTRVCRKSLAKFFIVHSLVKRLFPDSIELFTRTSSSVSALSRLSFKFTEMWGI